MLRFKHVGLNPKLECYQICERGWDHFLKSSLKTMSKQARAGL